MPNRLKYLDSRRIGNANGTNYARAACLTSFILIASVWPAHADNVRGAWSDVFDWPIIAIHSVLTPDGRVMTYGTDQNGKQTGKFVYDIWDPEAGPEAGHITLQNTTNTDIFCSAQLVLPGSGDVLVAGGDNFVNGGTNNTGNKNSTLFRSATNKLTRAANMNRARWYGTATALPNGTVYLQGGAGGADRPEIRAADGSFKLLNGADTNSLNWFYPRNFVVRDGRVFGFDSSGNMYHITTQDSGLVSPAGKLPSANTANDSSAVMFRPGMILQCGGNSKGAVVIDVTGHRADVSATADMSTQRRLLNTTVIADGRVVATGGSRQWNKLVGVNNVAEIWDPETGEWTQGAVADKPRLYHSTALLLPDARILVAGGGAPGPVKNLNAEIYSPPYLFDANGNLAERPLIDDAPNVVSIGQSFALDVSSASPIARVTFVKTGSVTHSFNMDQRFLDLAFSAAGGTLTVQAPANGADAPPGTYLVFVIDDKGVPSKARIVQVNPAADQTFAVNWTPLVGGKGGTEFELACQSDEILVGVHGRAASGLNAIGPRCVSLDDQGRWVGDPVNRGSKGGTGGSVFSRTCARDQAVAGFKTRSDTLVKRLEMQCAALNGSGRVEAGGVFLGAIGGTGGKERGAFRCRTENPAHAIYGRTGSLVDAFGILCRPVDLPEPPDTGSNTVSDIAGETQVVEDVDAFVIDGNSNDYGWGETEDGKGIVVWNGDGFDLLFDVGEIRFSDRTVKLGDDEPGDPGDPGTGGSEVTDVPGETQYVDDVTTFIVSGKSSDYGWGETEDGKGFVIWSSQGFDILTNVKEIRFNDRTVKLSDDDPGGEEPGGNDTVADVPGETQYINDVDIFVINGKSSDYGWGPTDDGDGVVVWGSTGFDILTDVRKIRFDDKTVELST